MEIIIVLFAIIFVWIIFGFSSKKDIGWSDLEALFKISRKDFREMTLGQKRSMTGRGYFEYRQKRYEPVKISCSEKGVLMSRPLPLIFFGFSPILIPWSELSGRFQDPGADRCCGPAERR